MIDGATEARNATRRCPRVRVHVFVGVAWVLRQWDYKIKGFIRHPEKRLVRSVRATRGSRRTWGPGVDGWRPTRRRQRRWAL